MGDQAIRAVLFDWDQTLGAVMGDVSDAERFAALFREAALPYDGPTIAQAMATRHRAIEGGTLAGALHPQSNQEWLLYYQQLLDVLGYPNLPLAEAERLSAGFARLPFQLFDETLPTLQALAARGLRLGVITNHAVSIRPTIERALATLVAPAHITISGELAIAKPDGAIFAHAARTLDLSPGECMYVGDNIYVDAIGAVTFGGYARALWLPRHAPTQHTHAAPPQVHRIAALAQVLEYLDAPI